MKKPKISVVIPSRDGRHYLNDCLSSVLNQGCKDFEVVVVDDVSTDGSAGFIKKKFPKVKLIINKKNQGYAGSVNIGVEHSRGEYIAVLNNDTKVDKRWLIEMMDLLESKDSIAIVGSRINNIGFYNAQTLGTLINPLGDPIDIKSKDKTLTFLASGCSLLFKKSIIGMPFDPEYFIYSEDLYMAWLARLKGYDVKIAPNSKLMHYGYQTMGKMSEKGEFHMEKNRITNLLLFYEKKNLIKITPLLLSYIALNSVFCIFNGKVLLRMKSYWWLIANWKRLMLKRKKIQEQRKVPDSEIFRYMTYKIQCGLGLFDKLISGLIYLYCVLFNLKIYELSDKNRP